MKKGGGSESTISSRSILVYALHSLEYVLGPISGVRAKYIYIYIVGPNEHQDISGSLTGIVKPFNVTAGHTPLRSVNIISADFSTLIKILQYLSHFSRINSSIWM